MVGAYVAISLSLLAALGVLALGHRHTHNFVPLPRLQTLADVQESASATIIDAIDPENIKKNLRIFTKEPHQAGTKANERVALAIEKLYKDAGLYKVHTNTYEVLLSYPDWDRPNQVRIVDKRKRVVFASKGVSPVVFPEEQGAPHAGHEWVAYSAPGVVEADVVYCNYGSPKDFENVKKMGIDVTGKIAIMRYGEGFRGDKVAAAQRAGAAAVILFSDPADVAREGTRRVYPSTVWMPPEGVQRGSIMKLNGDPLTPLYAAKPGSFKSRTIEEAIEEGVIPSIPAIPVSYTTAYQLFSRMQGRPVPLAWQGEVNVTYKMGPGLTDGQKVTVDVKASLETRQIHNVIGYIPGMDEEDRYVILGNHYDAWVYGSIDPNSGTAILAEVARAMVETTKKTQWKPARTLMFSAWDAEEYGLIGSNEFVEEFVEQLSTRAVVYLNMDCFQGNHSLAVRTVPTLYDIAVAAAKKIPNPVQSEVRRGRKSLYDTWQKTFPGPSGSSLPGIDIPGGGSDHAPFLNFAGVPVIDFNFKNATTRDTYPLYHTLYETPYVNEHLYDHDNFSVHRAIGQYWAELARTFADSTVLPLNASRLAEQLATVFVADLRKAVAKLPAVEELAPARDALATLEGAVQAFVRSSAKFATLEGRTRINLEKNPFDLRALKGVNERLMMVDRCFVNPRGMPGSPEKRHILFSLSDNDSYTGAVMAAIYDAMTSFESAKDRRKAGRGVAQQINIVYHAVNCAAASLRHFI